MGNKKYTWRVALNRYRRSAFESNIGAAYEVATIQMKEDYPGEYIVEEYFDPKTCTFDVRLRFDTPEDETFFHLKYE